MAFKLSENLSVKKVLKLLLQLLQYTGICLRIENMNMYPDKKANMGEV